MYLGHFIFSPLERIWNFLKHGDRKFHFLHCATLKVLFQLIKTSGGQNVSIEKLIINKLTMYFSFKITISLACTGDYLLLQ